jgi:hypothetical protein
VRWSEKTTTEIFKQAGVEVAWVDCPVSTRQLGKSPVCRGEMGTTDFAVRILTQPMAATLSTTNHPMGLAQECPDDERGCVANILNPRVGELATQVADKVAFQGEGADCQNPGPRDGARGGSFAAGPNAHAASGLMRGLWSPDDLRFMNWSYLAFTPQQSTQLRASVVRRHAVEVSLAVQSSRFESGWRWAEVGDRDLLNPNVMRDGMHDWCSPTKGWPERSPPGAIIGDGQDKGGSTEGSGNR